MDPCPGPGRGQQQDVTSSQGQGAEQLRKAQIIADGQTESDPIQLEAGCRVSGPENLGLVDVSGPEEMGLAVDDQDLPVRSPGHQGVGMVVAVGQADATDEAEGELPGQAGQDALGGFPGCGSVTGHSAQVVTQVGQFREQEESASSCGPFLGVDPDFFQIALDISGNSGDLNGCDAHVVPACKKLTVRKKMPELYLDCPAGIAGDMFLAAMADLGVDLAVLGATFRHAGLQVDVAAVQARSQGIAGTRLHIEGPAKQPLRHLHDLTGIIGKLPVSEQVRSRSQAALERLGQVEAKVHDVELEQIHFHEIGAVDTLVDVVGAFWAVECLGVTRVTCSKLPWFSGTVRCAHGLMPLPAPATLELLRGKPVYASEYVQEVITPTGALLVDQLVDEFASGPVGRIERTGLGLGTMDLGTVNGLRAMLFPAGSRAQSGSWCWRPMSIT